MIRVEWECSQCGAAGAIDYSGDPTMRQVRNDIDNAHAASSPECPLDRDRITVRGYESRDGGA